MPGYDGAIFQLSEKLKRLKKKKMTVNSFLLTGFVVSFVMVMFAMKYKVDK